MLDKAIMDKLDVVCEIINDTVQAKEIYLFGSYVRGTQNNNSDFDLYVVIPDESTRQVDAIKQIHRALYKKSDIPLDILVETAENFAKRSQMPTLEQTVCREGLKLRVQ